MFYTKLQDHQTSNSNKENLLKVFTISGQSSHFGHVVLKKKNIKGFMCVAAIWTIHTNFRSPFPGMFHMKLSFIDQAVLEEKIFEKCGRTDGGRQKMGIIFYAKYI